jgi:hypothetical protein
MNLPLPPRMRPQAPALGCKLRSASHLRLLLLKGVVQHKHPPNHKKRKYVVFLFRVVCQFFSVCLVIVVVGLLGPPPPAYVGAHYTPLFLNNERHRSGPNEKLRLGFGTGAS